MIFWPGDVISWSPTVIFGSEFSMIFWPPNEALDEERKHIGEPTLGRARALIQTSPRHRGYKWGRAQKAK